MKSTIKTLTKHGNSLALILDKAILQLLKIEESTELEISTDGTRLIITPIIDDVEIVSDRSNSLAGYYGKSKNRKKLDN